MYTDLGRPGNTFTVAGDREQSSFFLQISTIGDCNLTHFQSWLTWQSLEKIRVTVLIG